MSYDVLVVGAGVGGLTTAALLTARGLKVCVFERASAAGGCATPFVHGEYEFDPGAGLYAGWAEDEIHARVFAELPTRAPETRRLETAYVVRLPDMTDVPVGCVGDEEWAGVLRAAFPECAPAAVQFYRALRPLAEALRRAAQRVPALATASKLQRLRLLATEPRVGRQLRARQRELTAPHLAGTSARFRRFVDLQLQNFTQTTSADCPYLYAALALTAPQRGLYELCGGTRALTRALLEAIRLGGGTVRLDTTVLRLAYDRSGRATGVELLSGERIAATRAIVSNLTVWDTYGKLVGLKRTPADVRAQLRTAASWGAYLIFAALDEQVGARLPAPRIFALTDWQDGQPYEPTTAQLIFNAAPASQRTDAPSCTATILSFTDAQQWFAYHEDERGHEAQDQAWLEATWARLHTALPELGAEIEIIETATPRTYYEQTRRRLGMIGGLSQKLDATNAPGFTHRTALPNLYMVGDTVFPGASLAAVTHSALIVADEIAAPSR